MNFGSVPVLEAVGGLLAHQVKAGETVFRKSHALSAADCAALVAAGVTHVTIAQLEPGDIGEDEAARRLAAAACGGAIRVDPAFTGRANLFAETAGVFVPDSATIDRFNALDPAMTLATLPAFRRVEPGEMVGTVKIIPFAVPETVIAAGTACLAAVPLRVAPFQPKRVAMLSLRLPGLKESVIDKTVKVTEARLTALGGCLVIERRLEHAQGALEAALRALDPDAFDILIVFGAAAIADRRDVIPAAIEASGGRILHFGMPVDPGNLMLLAEFAGKPAFGAPGCARSPRENGFDWVLARAFADIPVTAADIQGMGVGGLLMEIVSRPQPRAGEAPEVTEAREIAALILAAGRSTRFGAENKLLAPFEGRAMLAHALDRAREAGCSPVIVVTGHEAEAIRAAAPEAQFVHNPAYAEGLSTSLRAGIAALPETVGASFILLGDMPSVSGATLRRLLAAAQEHPVMQAFVPTFAGRWGNPVLVRRALFPSLGRLHGDQGARKLLEASREVVEEIPVEDPGILADYDTQAALAAATSGEPQNFR
jgi:molybdenum cofactor cytidylyltransferase